MPSVSAISSRVIPWSESPISIALIKSAPGGMAWMIMAMARLTSASVMNTVLSLAICFFHCVKLLRYTTQFWLKDLIMSRLQAKKLYSAAQVIEILKDFYHCGNDAELNRYLGLSKGAIGMWRARETIPPLVWFLVENIEKLSQDQAREPQPIYKPPPPPVPVESLEKPAAEWAAAFAQWRAKIERELADLRADIRKMRGENGHSQDKP